jgi:hypothetical protein
MLLGREDLATSAERSKPLLNRWATARATVLALCDGSRELGDIEQLVFERHRDLFTHASQAQVFVAEVVTRYGDTGSLE